MIIFFDWDKEETGGPDGLSDHVGIVESVTGNKITVIEGNKNNAVGRRTLSVNGKYIRGYGVPKYDNPTVAKKSNTEIAKEVIVGKWGNGAKRKRKLTEAGYDYKEVQAIVNKMMK